MAVTITTVHTRPDTSADFYYNTNTTLTQELKTLREQDEANGVMTFSLTYSQDGLNETAVSTYTDISGLNTRLNRHSIAYIHEYQNYTNTHSHTTTSYVMTGIDSAFTCTTDYTFPTAGLSSHTSLSNLLTDNTNGKLANLVVTDTNITAIHRYDNSTDYSSNAWRDAFVIDSLYTDGVTRTTTFAMV